MLKLADSQIEQVELPSGVYTFRRMDLTTDLPRNVRLVNEIEAVDQIGWGTTEAELRADLTSPNYDVRQDGWIVEEPGQPDRLIAEGWSFRILNSERAGVGARVHPAWRRRGLGSELLRRAMTRAAEQGARYVDVGAMAPTRRPMPSCAGTALPPSKPGWRCAARQTVRWTHRSGPPAIRYGPTAPSRTWRSSPLR